MSRWNIARILFFSHDDRRRDIQLRPGEVNIITGDSHTGKSGVAEVIDYVMGASECHIPGVIRDATSWVGLAWVRDDTTCVLCRMIPAASEKSASEYTVIVGRDQPLPSGASSLPGRVTRSAALSKFEQLLGIGAVETEATSGAIRPSRISVRQTIPYLLQDDQHIINKAVLLRGGDDEHKQSIIDTLPYFLGIIDERSYADESRLQRLRAQLESAERQRESQHRLASRNVDAARVLVDEARQVGLVEPPLTNADPVETLRSILTDDSPPNPFPNDQRLSELYDEQRRVSERLSGIKSRMEEMRRALRAYDDYVESASGQRARLQAIDLIPMTYGGEACPLCSQKLPHATDSVEKVRAAFDSIRGDLEGVARDRPKLDRVLRSLEADRASTSEQLGRVRESIRALVRESRQRRQTFELAQRQYRVRGRISLFTEAVEAATAPESATITRLRTEILDLEERLNAAARREDLDAVRARILDFAREIAAGLPLEDRYRDNPIDFNPRTLEVGIATSRRRIGMRDVGSDENYLTLHVALLLALHRVFTERERPVPGVILFDQISRPYYPPMEGEGKEQVIAASAGAEVDSLRRYFAALFAEVARGTGLQVIVLEKAFFADDQRYVSATVERWSGNNKLIPADWPEK